VTKHLNDRQSTTAHKTYRYFVILLVFNYCFALKAGRNFMAAANEPPMTSPSSSNSTGQEPQLPPLLPPLRSTQHILQPLSVFPGAKIFYKMNA
jgi:hypothetical protein